MPDVFVHDRQSGTTERVSVDSSGNQGNGSSFYLSISADGRYVAFESYATNLVNGDQNGWEDIFVRDRQSGTTELVSVGWGGVQGHKGSHTPSISANGRYVAFSSWAPNLISGDTNGSEDIFVHDRQTDKTERVSVDSGGGEGNEHSYHPSISADGRSVAFWSLATNLVIGDTNGFLDAFVHDRQSATTERVSIDSGGVQGNLASRSSSISADGRYVAFWSDATNLVGGDTNGTTDAFVHDRHSGTTERVSLDSGGVQGNGLSYGHSSSADGRYAAFGSYASNLVGGDTNGTWDVFVRDLLTGIGWEYCNANANSTGSPAGLSASGSASSGAGDLMLLSTPVPNQNGTFFHGPIQTQLPFGNGFLCTTGGLVRGAVVAGVGNAATYTYDNSDSKHSLAAFVGSTRNFQHWFHDPLGGGAFFNTSTAISIVILP